MFLKFFKHLGLMYLTSWNTKHSSVMRENLLFGQKQKRDGFYGNFRLAFKVTFGKSKDHWEIDELNQLFRKPKYVFILPSHSWPSMC